LNPTDKNNTAVNESQASTEQEIARLLLPDQPHDESGPVFDEPWQAQAFALTVKLHQQGHFTWKEWTETIGGEFSTAVADGKPDDGTHYYEHWLAALEKMIRSKGLLDEETIQSRRDAWEYAYRTTTHGQPVHLKGE